MHIRATGQSKMGEAKDSNDVMGGSSKTGASLSIWLTNRFLAVVAMFNIPMNSIVTISIPYLIVWFTTDRLWLKALMVIYWPFYSMMDTTPQRLTKPAFVRKLQHYCRRVPFIRATGDYFPCTLRKTCELSPEETYLFAYHPHGVISMGANLGMSTEAGHFERVFPGIQRSGVTLNATFFAPFYREWLLCLGFCSANKSTLASRLQNKESLILVPGGAQEALHAHPGVMKLHIMRRKGFIKLALETKAKLVPCIGFGENDIYDTLYLGKNANDSSSLPSADGTTPWLWKLQRGLKKYLSFSTPILTHIIPKQVPINVVVGKPVQFPESDTTTVDKCHAMYLEALKSLYEEHKGKYGYENVKLELI